MPQLKHWKKDGRSDTLRKHKKHSSLKVKVEEQPHGYTVILTPTSPMMFEPQILTNESTKREAIEFARDWMKAHSDPTNLVQTRRGE